MMSMRGAGKGYILRGELDLAGNDTRWPFLLTGVFVQQFETGP